MIVDELIKLFMYVFNLYDCKCELRSKYEKPWEFVVNEEEDVVKDYGAMEAEGFVNHIYYKCRRCGREKGHKSHFYSTDKKWKEQ